MNIFKHIFNQFLLSLLLPSILTHICYNINNSPRNPYHDYHPTANICIPCIYTCSICNSQKSQSMCTCQIGFYLSPDNNRCLSCITNCQICASSLNCIQCSSNYYYNGTQCIPCKIGTSVCSISSSLQCKSGYFYSNNLLCEICIPNCDVCLDSISCISCFIKYYYNTTSSSCLVCMDNCQKCYTTNTCQVCIQGFYLDQTAIVCNKYVCITLNCLQCTSNASYCTLCKNGYYVTNGSCIRGGSIMCKYSMNYDFGSCIKCNSNFSYAPINTQTYCIPVLKNLSYNYIFLTAINNPDIFDSPMQICDLYITQPAKTFTVKIVLSSSYLIQIYFNLFFNTSQSPLILNITINQTIIRSNLTLISNQTTKYCNTDIVGIISQMLNYSVSLSLNLQLSLKSNSLFSISQILIIQKLCQISNCYICSSSFTCTICISPYLLFKNICLQSCDSGYYTNIILGKCQVICSESYYSDLTNYECLPCKSPCKTCLSEFRCLSCIQKYFFFNFSCWIQCPLNTTYPYIISNSCQSCINPCKTCFNSGLNCTSCISGYLSNNSCVGECPFGTYGSFSSIVICTICKGCASCQISQNNCLSCYNSTFLFNNSCLNECPVGYYNDNLKSNVCIKCLLTCKACNYLKNNCTSCLIGNYLYNITIKLGKCLLNCPQGYFNQMVNNSYVCSICQSACIQCISFLNCQRCVNISNKIYFLQNGTCNLYCDSGFLNIANNSCSSCKSPCRTCIKDTLGINCKSCLLSLYLYNNSCVLKCPSSYYFNNQIFTCQKCLQICNTCSNSTSCDTCKVPQLNYTQMIASTLLFVYFNNTCVNFTGCPLNYFSFKNTSTGLYNCLICGILCRTCVNITTLCTSCYQNYYMLNNQCLNKCPQGYFMSVNICQLCLNSCKSCINMAQNCTTCSLNLYLFNNSCNNFCPSSYYISMQNSSCLSCKLNCSRCISYIICTSCTLQSKLFLYQYQCIQNCPPGTIGMARQCVVCSVLNCYSCSIIPNNCSICNLNFYKQTDQNQISSCQLACPDFYYTDQINSICSKCKVPCMLCSSKIMCLSCIINSTLKTYLSNYRCVDNCPFGTFADNGSNTCLKCLQPCLSCQNKTICLSCRIGWYYFDKKCISQCLNGFYGSKIQNKCILCEIPCISCNNDSFCLKCTNGYSLQNNTCISTCLTGTFNNILTSNCDACDKSCLICVNISTNCLTCSINYIFLTLQNLCVTSCPTHYYLKQNIQGLNQCFICSNNCNNCSSYSICTSCDPKLYLQQGSCVINCSLSYYNTLDYKNNDICLQCIQNCFNCSSLNNCSECQQSFFLFQNYSCIQNCPKGYFQVIDLIQICKPCPKICQQCINQFYCTSCVENYAKLQSYCIQLPCLQPYYYNIYTNQCLLKCPQQTLINPKKKICYFQTCPLQLVKYTDNCLSKCPYNYYINSNIQCQLCRSSQCQQINLLNFKAIAIYLSSSIKILIMFNKPIKLINFVQKSLFKVYINNSESFNTRLLYETQLQNIKSNSIMINTEIKTSFMNSYIIVSQTNPYRNFIDYQNNIIQNYKYYIYVSRYEYYHETGTKVIAILLVIFLFILVTFSMYIKKFQMMWVSIDHCQLIYFLLFLNIQFPPSLEAFLQIFMITNFRFFPYLKIDDSILQDISKNTKFYNYTIDINFLRNISCDIYILAGLVMFLGIIWVLKKYFLYLRNDEGRIIKLINWLWQMKKLYVFQILQLIYLNCAFFCFLQYNDMNTQGSNSSFLKFNLFLCVLTTLTTILLPIIFTVYAYRLLQFKQQKIFPNQQSQPLIYLFFYDVDLQKKKLSNLIKFYRFLRKLTFAVSFALYPENIFYVLTFTMFHTSLLFIIVYIYRPYKNSYKNIYLMLIDGIFFFILFGLFLIGLNNDMDIEIKYGIGILMQIGLAVLILLTFYEIGIRIKEKIKQYLNRNKEMIIKNKQMKLDEIDKHMVIQNEVMIQNEIVFEEKQEQN